MKIKCPETRKDVQYIQLKIKEQPNYEVFSRLDGPVK